MNKQEIEERIAKLEEEEFILQMDDWAYYNGKMDRIDACRKEVAELKKKLQELEYDK